MPPEVLARMSPEMHRLIGLYDWPPDYSAVKKITPEQIAALTPEERRCSWVYDLLRNARRRVSH